MILKFIFYSKWNKEVALRKSCAENHLLKIDTENKTFEYTVTPWMGDSSYVKVSKNDLLDIMDKAQKDGYALKIGGI